MKKILNIALIALIFVSCGKEKNPPKITPYSGKLIVLNEGFQGMNNGTITHYDSGVVHQNVFFNQNAQFLGDTPNDILIYGEKIYIAVGGSSTLEITDLNFKSIRQISFDGISINARTPQSLAAHNGKIYIVCFDGNLARLDTSSLTVDNIIPIGKNPENIAISNGFAYVTNSGGMDGFSMGSPEYYDSTVSVINLATFIEEEKIVVGKNPFSIGVDENGNIIVGCRGDYGWTIPLSLHRINAVNRTVHTFPDVAPSEFVIHKSTIYFYNVTYSPSWDVEGIEYIAYNTLTESKANFLSNSNLIQMPYAININSENENVYISCSATQKVFVFDKLGVKLSEFDTGVMPKRIVVLKK
jgi:hypothetical protein